MSPIEKLAAFYPEVAELLAERDALAAEVGEWQRIGLAILRTHRSGDVVLLQEDADAITARLLGESS